MRTRPLSMICPACRNSIHYNTTKCPYCTTDIKKETVKGENYWESNASDNKKSSTKKRIISFSIIINVLVFLMGHKELIKMFGYWLIIIFPISFFVIYLMFYALLAVPVNDTYNKIK
jgi:hypothetical protein